MDFGKTEAAEEQTNFVNNKFKSAFKKLVNDKFRVPIVKAAKPTEENAVVDPYDSDA